MKTIAITGGKGGTGKTLIAVNLAVQFAKNGHKILLVDTDVENPNSNLLLGESLSRPDTTTEDIGLFKPIIVEELCTQCGQCREACYRHAILQFPGSTPIVLDHLCSGCHICEKVCPTEAITAGSRKIGTKYFLPQVRANLDLLVGELTPSEVNSVEILNSLFETMQEKYAQNGYDLVILDTSPGAHCDVEKVLKASDNIVCVTEPTPFGNHDLSRIIDLIKLMNKQTYVLINRANISDYQLARLKGPGKEIIQVLGEIPLDNQVIFDYAKGLPFVEDQADFPAKTAFLQIYDQLNRIIFEEISHE